MNYLLDTHIAIWAVFSPDYISNSVKEILLNPKNEIFTSTISFWEISLKYGLGKLQLRGENPEIIKHELVNTCDIKIIDITLEDTLSFYKLTTFHHKDPFDRMLIWQALRYKLTFITDDQKVHKYADCGLLVKW